MNTPVQVIIGRGRMDQIPLPAEEWGRFQLGVLVALDEFYRLIMGLGVDLNGRAEEQVTILGAVEEENLDEFRAELNDLRIEHVQRVILLVVGKLEVIGE